MFSVLRRVSTAQYVRQFHHATPVRQSTSSQDDPSGQMQSLFSKFHNMFDRGPNVGVEIITKHGFVLSSNVEVNEPLILLNGSAFLWRVTPDLVLDNADLEAFKIFEVTTPKPELVLFGTGKSFAPLPAPLRQYFYKLGIQVDQMNTKHAAATYNVLAEEGRRVAAALLPLNITDNNKSQ